MTNRDENDSFWTRFIQFWNTFGAVLTAIAAFITAVTGLLWWYNPNPIKDENVVTEEGDRLVDQSPSTPPFVNNINSMERLDQVIPTYVSSALSPEAAFTSCPGSTSLYLLGETKKHYFAVCEDKGNPKYYLGKYKSGGEQITVPWKDGFWNGSYLYEPPGYSRHHSSDREMRIYREGQLLKNYRIVRLYKRRE